MRESTRFNRNESFLKIVPLGGLGEIGMNCLIFETHRDMILIDCGIQFPGASYAGVELLAPDLSYIQSRLKMLRGIIITHGHEDHIGAIPYLAQMHKLNVYSTPFPKGLIQQKLTEVPDTHPIHFHEIKDGKSFTVGSFTFHPIPVQHSIIESMAFVIETPAGNIVHTGDFKHDPSEMNGISIGFEPFREWSKQGILLLLSDSTNAEMEGHTLSEVNIKHTFDRVMDQQNGRIIIALFASNIRRIENLLILASQHGKKVALAGRSMNFYTRLAFEQSSLAIPENTLIPLETIHDYPDNNIIILATGSQAEPRSVLVRIAEGNHPQIQIKESDQFILSSRFIPGNEKAITSMIDQLYRSGADVLYESIHQIHVSGHGFQDELLMMLKAVKPKFFIPIHGEYRHLAKHAKLARQVGIHANNVYVIENGQTLVIENEKLSLTERLELHKMAIVDNTPLEDNSEAFTKRIAIAKAGVVFVALIRDVQNNKLVVPPIVCAEGLLFRSGHSIETTLEDAKRMLLDLTHRAFHKKDVREFFRLEIRRFFKKRASYKPVVLISIINT